MAQPVRDVPEGATNIEPERPQEGEEALRSVLEEYGGDYADAAEYTDELENVLETAILVIASADDEEVDYVTESVVTLVEAGDAISNEGTVTLAESFGENSGEFADLLDDVIELKKSGQLDALLDLAATFSALEADETTANALNDVLGAVGDAEEESESMGLFGAMRAMSGSDARAGLGYVVEILKGLGRRTN
ncbi:hypothetical protein MBEHAL_0412 [Halarchaeum acidiphilum MH1-52-1]|uniref:DUF1641 domain-containing protein n=1 Tax=Halarchaeum acidiphilum MH1-52-1 TaxID=1261545 RepID=U2YSC5_9EURY|nr:DUF1641 domain-containing protein [Halarchaeum acidiphilum]GAD51652.1 hypothetical protein MBEHAL_0412 [Halarchaeum acidiphilum MH1-52-1]